MFTADDVQAANPFELAEHVTLLREVAQLQRDSIVLLDEVVASLHGIIAEKDCSIALLQKEIELLKRVHELEMQAVSPSR